MSQRGRGGRGDRIRTYNFPQNRVTDHRLEGDQKNFSLEKIMTGALVPIHRVLQEEERLARHGKKA